MTIDTKYFWQGELGRAYTDRNRQTMQELDQIYQGRIETTRTEMNNQFVGDLDRNMRILEVGCNVGNQLMRLRSMGFKNLYGIDISYYVLNIAKSRDSLNAIYGDAPDIPFKDSYFDMVYTSNVLIHIPPDTIERVIKEITRCTNQYIWCYEFYSDKLQHVNYRGIDNILWKADYMGMFLKDPAIRTVKQKFYNYNDGTGNVDSMFLLEKVKS